MNLQDGSCWQASQVDSTPTDELSSATDVLIIGGGLTGLSAAYHLKRRLPELKITLVESQAIGFGASTRNSGMLTPGVGQSLAALVRRYGADKATAMYQVSLDAVKYVEKLAQRERLDIGLRNTGQLVVARGPAGRNRLRKQAELMQRLDLPYEELDDAGLQSRVAIHNESRGSGPAALRMPIAGVLDPGKLVTGLARCITQSGVTVIQQAPVEKLQADGVRLVDGRTISADTVIVATGGYNRLLGAQQGRLIPFHLRMALTRRLLPQELDTIAWRNREGAIDSRRVFNYFRLTDDDRLLLGGGVPKYRWGGNVSPLMANQSELSSLAEDLRHYFPGLMDIEFERSWSGVIAYSLDTLPVIGRLNVAQSNGHNNAWHVGGWCGHGLALSVSSGRWMADRFLEKQITRSSAKPNEGATESPADTCPEAPWFRDRAPRLPTEVARWCGARVGGWATQRLDDVS